MTENIEVFTQSSIRITDENRRIYIDPFQMREAPKDADFILITHDHYDHFSPEDIEKVSTGKSVLIVPAKMIPQAEKLASIVGEIHSVMPGEHYGISGLEFDTVFAVGMEQGIFPSMRSMDSEADLEEERRLAYVTITRAKRHLYLMQSRERLLFGSYKQNPLSRFVKEIPEEYLAIDDRLPHIESGSAEISGIKGVSGIRAQMAAIQRQRTAPPVSSAGNGLQFTDGERISDAVFGEGTILRAEPMAGDYLLEVAFDTVGTKKLMAKYRKITKC